MKGKRQLLATLLYHSNLLRFLRRPVEKKLIVLNYHRIRPDVSTCLYPFQDGVFGPSASQFKLQIRWLMQNTTVISEEELADSLHSEKRISGISVLVTFDDGYIDNYTLAYPILKKYGVPAIFFVSSDLINMRNLGWWDIIAFIIKNSAEPYIIYEGQKICLQENKQHAIRFFYNLIERESRVETKDLLRLLSEACKSPFPSFELQDRELMTWSQIKEISENSKFFIGSHTHTHRILATLDIKSQEEEMIKSKRIIERKTGKKVRSIAYPVGGYEHFTPLTRSIAATCGYELGFSFNTGINVWNSIHPFDIKRITGPPNVCMLAATVTLPSIFSLA